MIYVFPAFAIGYLICFLIMRRELKRLRFNNEMLLNFHEKLLRQIDADEQQLRTTDELIEAYVQHLETHECRVIEKEEEWPEVIG